MEEVQLAIKEVAFSYYMRGKYIQYSTSKTHYFSPEEATRQNINFLVCTSFLRTLYVELLNFSTPPNPSNLIDYTKKNIDNAEVIIYSHVRSDGEMEMRINEGENKYRTIINPSINDVIPELQIGDILCFYNHGMLVYDVEKDKSGKVIDAIIMESSASSYINTKIPTLTYPNPNGVGFVSSSSTLFLSEHINNNFNKGAIEGTLGMQRFSNYTKWVNMNNIKKRSQVYIVLRFIQSDSKGNAVLKYTNTVNYPKNKYKYNDTMELSKKNLYRIKFRHLYIEKLVNKKNFNIVEIGDILIYHIIVKNNWTEKYEEDLIVTENYSEFVTFQKNYENKNIEFRKDLNNRQLKWNIGKLEKGEEVHIYYEVQVTRGKPYDIIKSIGYVGNIESSTIENIIGINLNKTQKDLIIKNYEKLSKKYNGKQLINEIYKESFDIDLKFDKFKINQLILNTNFSDIYTYTIYLSNNNTFLKSVLHNYWYSMAKIKYKFPEGGEEVNIYRPKSYRYIYKKKIDTIDNFVYPNTFKTGDILIYENYDDFYSVNLNKLVKKNITYEQGEYSYIYIEGRGFVGVNYGADGIQNTKDDRNYFNAKYYKDHNLKLYEGNIDNLNDELLELFNLQTLFGKDYYVILRPSLCFDLPIKESEEIKENNVGIIVFIIILLIVLLLACASVILWKYIRIKKRGEEFNLHSLKKELLQINE